MARILLVEDDYDSGDALRMLLRVGGHDVRWARSGEEACAIYGPAPTERSPFDLILFDLTLPDIDGVTLIDRLRTVAPLPPLIVHSAARDETVTRAAVTVRAAAVLRKPVDGVRILETVRQCLVSYDPVATSTLPKN